MGPAMQHVNALLYASPGVYRESMIALLVVRARLYVSNGDWDKADKDIEEFFRHTAGRQQKFHWMGAAHLIRGLVREHQGNANGAMEKSETGRVHPDPSRSDSKFFYSETADSAVSELYAMVLGGLTNEWRDADCEAYLKVIASRKSIVAGGANGAVLGASFAVFGVSPSILSDMWRTREVRRPPQTLLSSAALFAISRDSLQIGVHGDCKSRNRGGFSHARPRGNLWRARE